MDKTRAWTRPEWARWVLSLAACSRRVWGANVESKPKPVVSLVPCHSRVSLSVTSDTAPNCPLLLLLALP